MQSIIILLCLNIKFMEFYVFFKNVKCHNRLTYNFSNIVIVYIKSEEQYLSQYTKNNSKDWGIKKKIF